MNNFTLENTKDATHIHTGFDVFTFHNFNCVEEFLRSRKESRDKSKFTHPDKLNTYINLTDQTGRGYPTLEWFLKCGHKLEAGDELITRSPTYSRGGLIINSQLINAFNDISDSGCAYRHVKSLHDNRHDLTAMARDEWLSKQLDTGLPEAVKVKVAAMVDKSLRNMASKIRSKMGKQPKEDSHTLDITIETPEEKEAFEAIIDLTNKGDESDKYHGADRTVTITDGKPPKPIFTQAMADAGELPPAGSECMIYTYDSPSMMEGKSWYKARVLSIDSDLHSSLIVTYTCKWDCDFYVDAHPLEQLKFKPLDTRTDQEKLRDALVGVLSINVNYREEHADLLMSKFAITLNEGE